MTSADLKAHLQRLKLALEIHRRALEGLESALLEFEEVLVGESSVRPESDKGLDLLPIPDICQELGLFPATELPVLSILGNYLDGMRA